MRRAFGMVIAVTTVLLFSACRQNKEIVYFQDLKGDGQALLSEVQPEKYRIRENDILYIEVQSLDKEINEIFAKGSMTGANSMSQMGQPATQYILGYNVDSEGLVRLPVLGAVKVEGLATEQARDSLQVRLDEYLKDATVSVKLLNNRFSVIGEVKRPGVYYNFNNQLTVLEAISMAGDLNDYGEISKVVVIRKDDKKTQSFRLDLSSKEILTSDAYYLQPNDVVYVEPAKFKNFKINTPTFTLLLTSLTTLVVVLQYMNSF